MHFEELLNSRVDLCYLYSLLSRFGKIAMYIPISLLFPPPLTNAIDKINGYSGSTAGSMLLCGTSLGWSFTDAILLVLPIGFFGRKSRL